MLTVIWQYAILERRKKEGHAVDNNELLSQIALMLESQSKQIAQMQEQLQEHTHQVQEQLQEHTSQIDGRVGEYIRQVDEKLDEHTRQLKGEMAGYRLDLASMMEDHTHEIKLYVENNVTKKINALCDGFQMLRDEQKGIKTDIQKHDSQIDDLQVRVSVLENKSAT